LVPHADAHPPLVSRWGSRLCNDVVVRVGLHALGIGSGARRPVLDAVASNAESRGFSTLWVGEHVVMIDEPASRYPYSPDGRIPIAPDADWLDPFVALSFIAAATRDIRIATGVLLLAEHHPVVVAKQAASLDVLSGGRLALGVGVGWSAEEFAALGMPFRGRAKRMEEGIVAMRALWRDDVATFLGDDVRFEGVRVNPRPLRDRTVPIVIGGDSDAALDRAVRLGDGWYGFNLSAEAIADRVDSLRARCRAQGRDPGTLEIVVAPSEHRPGLRDQLEALGVDEVVVVASPPEEPGAVPSWLDQVAQEWLA